MNYEKFDGKKIEEVATRREDLSSYNSNFYEDNEGNIIYVWSNDDNYSTYTRITFVGGLKRYNEIFAESFTSNDDIIEVFDEFKNT